MHIALEDIGRRFNREWVFRHIDYRFETGQSYAVLGPNGSGKSTFLQVVAASLIPSAGRIHYADTEKKIDTESIYQYLSLAAPYMELIEEFTLTEQIRFHFALKNYLSGFDEEALMELLGLRRAKDRQIRHFSSGMKQRVKLALACCSDVPLVLLDEPTSNLDQQGIDWYLNLVTETRGARLVIVCSNQEREYGFCENLINIVDYK